MSDSQPPAQMITATSSTPPRPKITSLLSLLLAFPPEIRLNIYGRIASTSPILQIGHLPDSILSKPLPRPQDMFYAVLQGKYLSLLSVDPLIKRELSHFLAQPILYTEDMRFKIKHVFVHYKKHNADITSAMIHDWIEFYGRTRVSTILSVRRKTSGVRYEISYHAQRRHSSLGQALDVFIPVKWSRAGALDALKRALKQGDLAPPYQVSEHWDVRRVSGNEVTYYVQATKRSRVVAMGAYFFRRWKEGHQETIRRWRKF